MADDGKRQTLRHRLGSERERERERERGRDRQRRERDRGERETDRHTQRFGSST